MRNGSTIGLLLAGIAVVAGGGLVGYYYIGNQQQAAPKMQVPTSVITSTEPTPAAPPRAARPIAPAGEYTAPNAPNISIAETKAPIKPKSQPVAATSTSGSPGGSDSEASQTGLPAPSTGSGLKSTTSPSDSGMDPANPNRSDQSPVVVSTIAPKAGRTDETDQDGADGQNGSSSSENGSGSKTSQPAIMPPASVAPTTAPSASYHVEAGSFASQKNAQVLEASLRHKGYSAITLRRTVDGRDKYVVQVGAYRNQTTASQVVDSLQKDGYPATVSGGQ